MKTIPAIILYLVVALPICGMAQQKKLSMALGAEYFRPWGVSPDGFSQVPLSLQAGWNVNPEWRVLLTAGFDKDVYREEFIFLVDQPILFDTVTLLRNSALTNVFTDRAYALMPGIRYVPQGGPFERIRFTFGMDLIFALYPERTIIENREETTTNAGQVVQSSHSISTIVGYRGNGFGAQGALGVALLLWKGSSIGLEIGPGIFGKYRDMRHAVDTEGVNTLGTDPVVTTIFESQDETFYGPEYILLHRIRGALFLAWEF